MTPASGADHSLDHQTPLDVLSYFTVNLGQAADLPGQLHLTADVLRRVLGDVTVAFFIPQPDCWRPAIWPRW